MRRPYRVWCEIVLGLAVVVGCSKKKSETPTENTDPTPTANNGAASKDQAGRGNSSNSGSNGQQAGGGRMFGGGGGSGSGTGKASNTGAEPSSMEPTEAAPDRTPSEAAPPVPTPPTGAAVELIRSRFDKVEGALSAAKGKVVLVDCWARWCPPCIQSFPKLVEKHHKYGSKGLVCVSVSLDAGQKRYTPEQVHAFLKEQKATFQNFYLTDLRADGSAMDARFGKISGIPHAVLINRKGVKIWEGHPMDAGLVAKIEAELAK